MHGLAIGAWTSLMTLGRAAAPAHLQSRTMLLLARSSSSSSSERATILYAENSSTAANASSVGWKRSMSCAPAAIMTKRSTAAVAMPYASTCALPCVCASAPQRTSSCSWLGNSLARGSCKPALHMSCSRANSLEVLSLACA